MLALLQPIFLITLPLLSVFLIIIILLQRGRGGGLVGAFGGSGGQSAFGAKAGDVFTRITVVLVCIWIFLCILILLSMKGNEDAPARTGFGEGNVPSAATQTESGAPAGTPEPVAE